MISFSDGFGKRSGQHSMEHIAFLCQKPNRNDIFGITHSLKATNHLKTLNEVE